MTSPPAPVRSDPVSGSDGAAAPKRGMVLAAIVATLLLVGSIVALLLYRASLPQPNRVLVVRANQDWDGIELIVDGPALDKPKVTWVDKLGNYTVPFFLMPGEYTLHVKSQDVEVLRRSFDLTEPGTKEIDLT